MCVSNITGKDILDRGEIIVQLVFELRTFLLEACSLNERHVKLA